MTEQNIDETLDLRGTPCPMNFVKAKLKLEGMTRDSILGILLDDGDPVINVTGSVKEEGHQILKVEQIGDYWRLLVRKK